MRTFTLTRGSHNVDSLSTLNLFDVPCGVSECRCKSSAGYCRWSIADHREMELPYFISFHHLKKFGQQTQQLQLYDIRMRSDLVTGTHCTGC